jgi:hypothetical protein
MDLCRYPPIEKRYKWVNVQYWFNCHLLHSLETKEQSLGASLYGEVLLLVFL